MAYVPRSALDRPGANTAAFNSNTISHKVATRAQKKGGRPTGPVLYDDVNIPVSQITKITRQAQEKDQFRLNKMLVPGFKNIEEVKALAKLSGVDPATAKYNRPISPRAPQNKL